MACLFSRKRSQCTPRKKTADFAGRGAAFQLLRSLPLLRTNPACLVPCGVKTDLRRAGLQGTDQPGPRSSSHLVVSRAGDRTWGLGWDYGAKSLSEFFGYLKHIFLCQGVYVLIDSLLVSVWLNFWHKVSLWRSFGSPLTCYLGQTILELIWISLPLSFGCWN